LKWEDDTDRLLLRGYALAACSIGSFYFWFLEISGQARSTAHGSDPRVPLVREAGSGWPVARVIAPSRWWKIRRSMAYIAKGWWLLRRRFGLSHWKTVILVCGMT